MPSQHNFLSIINIDRPYLLVIHCSQWLCSDTLPNVKGPRSLVAVVMNSSTWLIMRWTIQERLSLSLWWLFHFFYSVFGTNVRLKFKYCASRVFSFQSQMCINTESELSNLMVCGVNFTSLFITVRDRHSPGVQCVPVTLPLRPLGAEMCLQLWTAVLFAF